ncbi:MAG: hypothetical protein EXS35_10975 [Pedosphaera sp.]|nr:hypothetical protein [Pedosphaera sp.]
MSNAETTPGHSRRLILRGLAWNSVFQVFLAATNFASMLLLVRILAPAEYGRANVATGFLAIITCFNCGSFSDQALQLRAGEAPDWSTHWRVGFYIQFALGVLCNVVGGFAWLVPTYRPVAPLLHVASIGLFLAWPSYLRISMLKRDMDFPRLRLLQGTGVIITAGSAAVLGLMGVGAYALIISSNVLHGMVYGFDLLVIRGWRPPAGWWRWPDWKKYRAQFRFGTQLSGTALLTAGRGLVESLILPRALGYEAIGLLNRAQVLFATTFGRLNGLIVETVYPLLPRSAHDPVQFARHATLVVQAMLLVSIPGAVFVLFEGPALSRLLYGVKWIAADPLIAPGTVLAWSVAAALLFGSILLAANRLKFSFAVSLAAACLSLPAMLVAWLHGGTLAYSWALAGGQFLAVAVGMGFCARLLERGWLWRTVLPPAVAAGIGGGALFGLGQLALDLPLVAHLAMSSVGYALVVLTVFRVGFPGPLRTVIVRLPGGERWCRWLTL